VKYAPESSQVTVRERATGAEMLRWSVDARELVATGHFEYVVADAAPVLPVVEEPVVVAPVVEEPTKGKK
jgi:hypothetical protein